MSTVRLSVVVPTDSFETIERLIDTLASQTVAAEVELVIVCPSTLQLDSERAAGALGAVRVVEHPLVPLGEARATGVRAAAGAVVAIGETHAFPAPEWAEVLLHAHEGPWAVVVPTVANGNPEGGAMSWSSLLIDYGRWTPGEDRGEVGDPPSYNAAFKKEVLLGFGDRLGRLLDPGSGLAAELGNRGYQAYHEPGARIQHLNLARPRAWLHERFLGGRLLASSRRARWSRSRVLLYLAGSPLVPLIRLLRSRAALRKAVRVGKLPPGTRAAVVLACVTWGLGEALGYAIGPGRAQEQMLEYELHKEQYA